MYNCIFDQVDLKHAELFIEHKKKEYEHCIKQARDYIDYFEEDGDNDNLVLSKLILETNFSCHGCYVVDIYNCVAKCEKKNCHIRLCDCCLHHDCNLLCPYCNSKLLKPYIGKDISEIVIDYLDIHKLNS